MHGQTLIEKIKKKKKQNYKNKINKIKHKKTSSQKKKLKPKIFRPKKGLDRFMI